MFIQILDNNCKTDIYKNKTKTCFVLVSSDNCLNDFQAIRYYEQTFNIQVNYININNIMEQINKFNDDHKMLHIDQNKIKTEIINSFCEQITNYLKKNDKYFLKSV